MQRLGLSKLLLGLAVKRTLTLKGSKGRVTRSKCRVALGFCFCSRRGMCSRLSSQASARGTGLVLLQVTKVMEVVLVVVRSTAEGRPDLIEHKVGSEE